MALKWRKYRNLPETSVDWLSFVLYFQSWRAPWRRSAAWSSRWRGSCCSWRRTTPCWTAITSRHSSSWRTCTGRRKYCLKRWVFFLSNKIFLGLSLPNRTVGFWILFFFRPHFPIPHVCRSSSWPCVWSRRHKNGIWCRMIWRCRTNRCLHFAHQRSSLSRISTIWRTWSRS